METKQHKDSVIARLMGLDDVPPQQTIHKRQRVLSENYLRRSASIGIREGSLFRLVKDVFDEHVLKKDEHNIIPVLDKEASYSASKTQMGMGRKKNASATILKSIRGHSYNYEGIFNKKRKQHARGNVLRSLQKLEKDSYTGYFEELGFDPLNKLKSRLERVDQPHLFSTSIVMLDPNSKMEKIKSIHIMSDLLPRSGDRDHDESLEPDRELLKEFTYKDQAVNDLDYRGSSGSEKFQSCPGTLKNKCNILRSPTSFQSSRYSVSRLDSENNNAAAHEKVTLMIQDEWANGPNMNDGSRDNQHDSRISNSTISNLASRSTVDILVNAEAENIEISTIHKLQKSEPIPGILSIKDRHSSSHVMETFTGRFCSHSPSHDWEALNGQVSSTSHEISKEAAASSNFLKLGLPELYSNLKGTNQCSPHSILEPFEEENSLTSEYFESVTTDFHSQQLQLQLPKSKSDETFSEGSGIGEISDSDTEERSHDPSDYGGKLLRFFGDAESRDFSYLVDVLDEARFQGLNLDKDFETWHSLECPVSPSVFEALEKKYGKQTSWQESHRQLLFNRINSGLREIFHPYTHFRMSTPFRRRFSAKLTRDDVEEELWMFLISQEKEESKGLFEKALGNELKWLDLDEDIDIICRELEAHLFDDLVLELVLFGIVE